MRNREFAVSMFAGLVVGCGVGAYVDAYESEGMPDAGVSDASFDTAAEDPHDASMANPWVNEGGLTIGDAGID